MASMADMAASGGYYIATSCHSILAERNTVTGSIGVFGVSYGVSQLLTDLGISYDVVKTTPHADMRSWYRSKSPEEALIVQKRVDSRYKIFIDRVVSGEV